MHGATAPRDVRTAVYSGREVRHAGQVKSLLREGRGRCRRAARRNKKRAELRG
ncbi:hypothetical protein [Streptomyces sp. NPDC087859]|uniref:hypothetical protein n=1 Tax=Streptomyces sp. NPDC087859 TaxID=3365812 RepID=UPI00381A94D0